ncbi:glycosyltransferase family 4 protein [Candidatus Kaiserbacteria bacterium]|nr:glycosyltransferase family 4 protein [Candidatus Kaiserbacteria bacterium]
MKEQKHILYATAARLSRRKAHVVSILNMCDSLHKRGHVVTLAVPKEEEVEEVVAQYDISPEVNIVQVPTIDISWLSAKVREWVRLWSFGKAVRMLSEEHDVVLTRDWALTLYVEDYIFLHGKPDFSRRNWKKRLENAQGIVVVNSIIKRILVDAGIEEGKIHVAPNGVDIASFSLDMNAQEMRGELGLPEDAKIVMYTGSFYLHDWKGVQVLLEAAALLPEYAFVMVGGGTAEIEGIKKEYKGDNIILREKQPHKDIPRYLQAADILVIPNTDNAKEGSHYTSPIKLFEYMASGRPIVASKLPSIQEIATEDIVQFVKTGDAEDLARGITEVLSDENTAATLAQRAREEVQNYTWDARARVVENIL